VSCVRDCPEWTALMAERAAEFQRKVNAWHAHVEMEIRPGRVVVTVLAVWPGEHALTRLIVRELAAWSDEARCAVTFDLVDRPKHWPYLVLAASAFGWRGMGAVPPWLARLDPLADEVLMRPFLGVTAREAWRQTVVDFHRLRGVARAVKRQWVAA
jgi:hypothetical protein